MTSLRKQNLAIKALHELKVMNDVVSAAAVVVVVFVESANENRISTNNVVHNHQGFTWSTSNFHQVKINTKNLNENCTRGTPIIFFFYLRISE
jgi:hypothetical protein